MTGPAIEARGGMTSVERMILLSVGRSTIITHIATFDDCHWIRKIGIFAKAMSSLFWNLMTTTVDVIHIHISQRGCVVRGIAVASMALAFRTPFVIHAHGSQFPDFYATLTTLSKWILHTVFRRANRFIVLSDSWRQFYVSRLSLSPDRVVTLPNPVVIPSTVPSLASRGRDILFLGRLGKRKGTFDLLRAFAKIPESEREDVSLILAGDGEIEAARALAVDLEIASSVKLLGWVSDSERQFVLGSCGIFALPSYNEGLPMSLLEAMAWGVPVVTTPVGGIPELVTSMQNGILVQPGDVEQLSTALRHLMNDPHLATELARAARVQVSGLAVTHYAEKLEHIYNAV